MTMATLSGFVQRYGMVFICALVYFEYLNLPGLPAGVVLPGVGVLSAQGALSLLGCIVVSVVFGLLGSMTLYGLFYVGGEPLMRHVVHKSKSLSRLVARAERYMQARRGRGLALSRLVPVLRTVISIPAGLLRVPVGRFAGWSVCGIAVWNAALISFGYFFGELLLR